MGVLGPRPAGDFNALVEPGSRDCGVDFGVGSILDISNSLKLGDEEMTDLVVHQTPQPLPP